MFLDTTGDISKHGEELGIGGPQIYQDGDAVIRGIKSNSDLTQYKYSSHYSRKEGGFNQ